MVSPHYFMLKGSLRSLIMKFYEIVKMKAVGRIASISHSKHFVPGIPPYNWLDQYGMPMAGENQMLGQYAQHQQQQQPPACQKMQQPQRQHDYHQPTHQWPATPPAPAYHELTSSVKV